MAGVQLSNVMRGHGTTKQRAQFLRPQTSSSGLADRPVAGSAPPGCPERADYRVRERVEVAVMCGPFAPWSTVVIWERVVVKEHGPCAAGANPGDQRVDAQTLQRLIGASLLQHILEYPCGACGPPRCRYWARASWDRVDSTVSRVHFQLPVAAFGYSRRVTKLATLIPRAPSELRLIS